MKNNQKSGYNINKISSNPLKVPQEYFDWFEKNEEELFNHFIDSNNNRSTIPFPEPIILINPYTKQEQELYIFFSFMPKDARQALLYSDIGEIVINTAFKYLVDHLPHLLIHEVSHAIDPKLIKDKVYEQQLDKSQTLQHPEYSSDTEFDAYSADIISYLKDELKYKSENLLLKNYYLENLLSFLKTNQPLSPDVFGHFFVGELNTILAYWSPQQIKRFKLRLFNTFFNNDSHHKSASKNLEIPKEFYSWFNDNEASLEQLITNVRNDKFPQLYPNPLEFINPYDQEAQSLNFIIAYLPEKRYLAEYSVYPDRINSGIITINAKFEHGNTLKYTLLHEITHAVDPKSRKGADLFFKLYQHEDAAKVPYGNPIEFDAYSKQMIEPLIDFIAMYKDSNPNLYNTLKENAIKDTISGDIFNRINNILTSSWSPKQKRRFQMRFLNELQKLDDDSHHKIASNILKFPPEFYTWWEENERGLKLYYKASHERTTRLIYPHKIIFQNPYHIHPFPQEEEYSVNHNIPQELTVIFNFLPDEPFNGLFIKKTQRIIINSAFYKPEELKGIIVHEFTHAIDPKVNQSNALFGNSQLHLSEESSAYASPVEFDAYSTEFVIEVLDMLQKYKQTVSPKKYQYYVSKIYNEIKTGKILTYLPEDLAKHWSPQQKRKLLLKLYSALQSNLPELKAFLTSSNLHKEANMVNNLIMNFINKSGGQIPAGMQHSILNSGIPGKSSYDSPFQYEKAKKKKKSKKPAKKSS